MTEAEIQQSLQALAQLGAAAGNSRASIQSLGQSMARLRMEMQRGAGNTAQHSATLRELMLDFDELDDQVKRTPAAMNIFAEQTKTAGELVKSSMGTLAGNLTKGGIVEAIDYFRNQFFTAIKNVQDNVSGMQAAFNLQNAALDKQISMLDKLQQGGAAAAETFAVLAKTPLGRSMAVLSGGVSVFAGILKGVSQTQKDIMTMLFTELQKTTLAFDSITASGGIFVKGLEDLRQTASLTQLDLAELSKFVANNNELLARLGGSVSGGIARFQEVSMSMKGFRRELLTLGYTYEQQAQGIAEYLEIQSMAGKRLSDLAPEDLAKGTRDYLVNLRAITAFTGEDAKRAQARAREASTQLAVQAKLQGMGAGAMERFQSGIKNMEPFMQKALQQAVAFDGTIVDQGLNQLFAMSPAREELFRRTQQDMMNQSLGAEEITRRYQEYVKELGPAMAKEAGSLGDSVGAVNLATGGLSELTRMLESTLSLGLKGANTEIENTNEQIKLLSERVGFLRLATVDLDLEQRKFASELSGPMTEALQIFMNQGLPGAKPEEGGQSVRDQLRAQNATTLALLEYAKLLPAIPPALSYLQEKVSKIDLSPAGQVASGLSEAASALKDSAGALLRAAGILMGTEIPSMQHGGVARGGLTRLHPGELVIPAEPGHEVAVVVKDPSGAMDRNKNTPQQVVIPEETMAKLAENLFKNPNIMTASIDNLKQQLAMDSQESKTIMKEYVGKMDTLIAAMEDNVDYSKRIADNIA